MKLRQGNVFTPVCQSFCSQESMHPPGMNVPPGMHLLARIPRHTCPPRILRDTANERAVRILLKCILVLKWVLNNQRLMLKRSMRIKVIFQYCRRATDGSHTDFWFCARSLVQINRHQDCRLQSISVRGESFETSLTPIGHS